MTFNVPAYEIKTNYHGIGNITMPQINICII